MNKMKFNIIACTDSNLVIGKNGNLLYKISDDLKYFKNMTLNNIVIMGYNTFNSLPTPVKPLPQRLNLVLSNDNSKYCNHIDSNNNGYIINSFKYIIEYLLSIQNVNNNNRKIFIIGGGKIYSDFMNYLSQDYYIDKIYLTHILSKSKSSTKELNDVNNKFVYFPKIYADTFTLTDNSDIFYDNTEKVNYVFLTYTNHKYNENVKENVNEIQYLNTLRKILNEGHNRENRTGIDTISIFGGQTEFDISESIPILTTKFVPTKGCIEELLWFLRGDTNAKHLQEKGVKVWDGNSTREFLDSIGLTHLEEGDCGKNYSHQWRRFGADYIDCNTQLNDDDYQGVDQVEEVLRMLKEDPFSRRIIISAWNPCDLKKTCLPSCHSFVQFYVDIDKNGQKHLSCHMYQRSCDMFLGEPWNIMSYAILTYIFALKSNMKPKKLIISFGDCHIYNNHLEQVNTQLTRCILCMPRLVIDNSVKDKEWNDIKFEDFKIIGYFHHSAIKGTMAV
jgi:thymidylate synthase